MTEIMNRIYINEIERPRLDYSHSMLASIGLQLLPYVQHDASKLEKLLVWQNACSQSWAENRQISLISWCSCAEEAEALRLLCHSLEVQSSRDFELLLIVLESDRFAESVLEILGEPSFRVRVFTIANKGLFSAALFEAGQAAIGSFIGVIPPRSFLHPSAVYILQKQLRNKLRDAEVVLVNELLLAADRLQPKFFWRKSPPDSFSLLCRNFWGEGFFVSKDIWSSLGTQSFNKLDLHRWLNGNASWGIALKLFGNGAKVRLLPLAIWLRTGIHDAQCIFPRSVEDLYLKEVGMESIKKLNLPFVSVEPSNIGNLPGLTPCLASASGTIQLIIPFRNQAQLTCQCLRSISRQTLANDLHVTLVDNGSLKEAIEIVESEAKALFPGRFDIMHDDGYFNFARLNNIAVKGRTFSFVLFLNNDIELEFPDTLRHMREWATIADVGLVGARLLYPDLGIQSAGIVFPAIGPANIMSELQFATVTREVQSVSFACAMLRTEVFEKVWLDEELCPNGFGDALFGKNIRDLGLKVVLCAEAWAIHHESRSRQSLPEELERLELAQHGIEVPVLHDDFHSEFHPFIVDYATIGSPNAIRLGRWLLKRQLFSGIIERVITLFSRLLK